MSILPPKYYTENPPEKVVFAPVGAGGYKFVSYRAGEGLVLKAFDKYRLGKPPVDDVVVKAVPEVATRISELKAGSADLIMGVPADLKQSLEKTSGVKVVVAPSYRRLFIAIKQGRHPALADVRVRQAMNHAINCEEIAASLIGGMANCRIDLVNAPYNNPGLKPFAYDPAKAKQLLDEAGWVVSGKDGVRAKNGVRLSLEMDTTNGSYLMDKEIAQVAADSWKEVGIEIKDLRVIDSAVNAQMRAKQGAGYRDLMNSSSGPDYTCQGDLLLVQKDSGSNRMSWSDEKFESLFRAFAQEFDQSKWQKMCYEAEAYAAQQAPVIWLFTEPNLYGVSDRLDLRCASGRAGLSQSRPQGREVGATESEHHSRRACDRRDHARSRRSVALPPAAMRTLGGIADTRSPADTLCRALFGRALAHVVSDHKQLWIQILCAAFPVTHPHTRHCRGNLRSFRPGPLAFDGATPPLIMYPINERIALLGLRVTSDRKSRWWPKRVWIGEARTVPPVRTGEARKQRPNSCFEEN